jgi:hypothetical protein
VVVVAFQIAFRAEIYANDVFSFFKNHFWYQHIKTILKVQTALNFSKKKKKKIWNSVKSRFNRRTKQPFPGHKFKSAIHNWCFKGRRCCTCYLQYSRSLGSGAPVYCGLNTSHLFTEIPLTTGFCKLLMQGIFGMEIQ